MSNGTYEMRDNTGSLFKNDRKTQDTHPDYKGSCKVEGTEFWLSAWLKTSNSGKRYMSLSMTPREQPQQATNTPQQGQPQPQGQADFYDNEEDIPF